MVLSSCLGSSVAPAATGPRHLPPSSAASSSLCPGRTGFVLPAQTGSSRGRGARGQTLQLCSWGEEWPPLCGGELEAELGTQDGGLRTGRPGPSPSPLPWAQAGAEGYTGSYIAWGPGGSSLETRSFHLSQMLSTSPLPLHTRTQRQRSNQGSAFTFRISPLVKGSGKGPRRRREERR